jgi:L-arabonate dehydrase
VVALRSAQWYSGNVRNAYIHRAWMRRGIPEDAFDRPQIAIANTASDLTPCNRHLTEVAAAVRDGVHAAGGTPLELPVVSLGETQVRPTAMLWRNMAAMATEEMLRANPIDGVVLLGGCDKTTPSILMGAASVDLPTLFVSGGPMLSGKYRGHDIGSGTNTWSMSEDLRAGKITLEEFHEAESCMHRSHGHCMTMGTASTMASMVESLGVALPGNAAYPAVDARRNVLARLGGRRIVEMVKENLVLSKILTKQAFENAIRANAAIGGSTNAVIHLIAIARRIGVDLTLDDWDRTGEGVHTLLNLMPSGKYLMEDFCYAGGLPVVLRELGENGRLHKDALTVNGRTIWENVRKAECWNRDVIHTFASPFKKNTGIKVLRGNLCPDGAIIKPSAATPKLMKHRGRAVVFENIEEFHRRIEDPKLDIDETCVMVLKNCGPKGYPGMAEVGNMPLPPKILKKGITDMVRISDARMSGTAYGTVVLHISPEAAAGGALALVQNGDQIELDVGKGRLQLLVSDKELKARRAKWTAPKPPLQRGYWKLYVDHVNQAHQGADLDFLVGKSGAFVPRDNH